VISGSSVLTQWGAGEDAKAGGCLVSKEGNADARPENDVWEGRRKVKTVRIPLPPPDSYIRFSYRILYLKIPSD